MAGLYIHIPFCREACNYCDFHFSISLSQRKRMIAALIREINMRKNYLEGENLDTIYFGGGTPSVLEADQIGSLLAQAAACFQIRADAEICMEVNPDDMKADYLESIFNKGINRLSIGIQSFLDEDLLQMNRQHSSSQAINSVRLAREKGFNNISIDLIFGLPGSDMDQWKYNLDTALGLDVEHISAYHLTYEPGTVLFYRRQKKRLKEISETASIEQFKYLMSTLGKAGYVNYEISNFAKPDYISLHNSSYWKQKKYLGIGPSAHSFNGFSRQWNLPKNRSYMEMIESGKEYFEQEILDKRTRYHDYLLTSLRTMWGTDLMYIKNELGEGYWNTCLVQANSYLKDGRLEIRDNKIYLTQRGKLIADRIISALFSDQ